MVSRKGEGQYRSSDVKGGDDTDLSFAGHLQTPDEVNGDSKHKEFGDRIKCRDELPSQVLNSQRLSQSACLCGEER